MTVVDPAGRIGTPGSRVERPCQNRLAALYAHVGAYRPKLCTVVSWGPELDECIPRKAGDPQTAINGKGVMSWQTKTGGRQCSANAHVVHDDTSPVVGRSKLRAFADGQRVGCRLMFAMGSRTHCVHRRLLGCLSRRASLLTGARANGSSGVPYRRTSRSRHAPTTRSRAHGVGLIEAWSPKVPLSASPAGLQEYDHVRPAGSLHRRSATWGRH